MRPWPKVASLPQITWLFNCLQYSEWIHYSHASFLVIVYYSSKILFLMTTFYTQEAKISLVTCRQLLLLDVKTPICSIRIIIIIIIIIINIIFHYYYYKAINNNNNKTLWPCPIKDSHWLPFVSSSNRELWPEVKFIFIPWTLLLWKSSSEHVFKRRETIA